MKTDIPGIWDVYIYLRYMYSEEGRYIVTFHFPFRAAGGIAMMRWGMSCQRCPTGNSESIDKVVCWRKSGVRYVYTIKRIIH